MKPYKGLGLAGQSAFNKQKNWETYTADDSFEEQPYEDDGEDFDAQPYDESDGDLRMDTAGKREKKGWAAVDPVMQAKRQKQYSKFVGEVQDSIPKVRKGDRDLEETDELGWTADTKAMQKERWRQEALKRGFSEEEFRVMWKHTMGK